MIALRRSRRMSTRVRNRSVQQVGLAVVCRTRALLPVYVDSHVRRPLRVYVDNSEGSRT
jgi:hypothetical protein